MELSICIPIFNFDVRELIAGLKKEIEINGIDAEIILIDDASDLSFNQMNASLQDNVQHLIFLEENIGRSKIRNLFLQYARGKYLLFLDCDVKIDSEKFLQNYLSNIKQRPDIELIYGNFKIATQYAATLRNRYSVEREIFSGAQSTDFSLFKTVNFIIKKNVFEKFPFNEELTDYGYEDFIFAKLLELNKVKFLAINNPVIHFDDTTNGVFLRKAEIGMNSLFKLSESGQNNVFIKDIKVYKVAMKLRQLKLSSLFLFAYGIFEDSIKKNLLSEHPHMKCFDFYKLGVLIRKMK
ncbi:glycosyltransferase involved in cell wall biosynthesis [Chryseobacterium rhizosphaerae]|uniref:Glycosyltransferase involved in cell wall biosynthesis n=1 Tax=Chryseobacterium rhizosphaerae TaxID=395937 RepID=A0AAE3YAP1_9FLAO|nr:MULTISPECIES: glycosyltransferase family A protein [Chryseobacterium]MBL3550012.1 glycosyltransferase family 2 protein [Chryseobacterium sp. KMC2]MDR6526673.1 glycosyltransferase involved in cell wall biosynthesis [Chryseobacterium rhizosphaerae]